MFISTPSTIFLKEVLLRSRAIETQSYVVAAAQAGKHSEKRASYGHAMVNERHIKYNVEIIVAPHVSKV